MAVPALLGGGNPLFDRRQRWVKGFARGLLPADRCPPTLTRRRKPKKNATPISCTSTEMGSGLLNLNRCLVHPLGNRPPGVVQTKLVQLQGCAPKSQAKVVFYRAHAWPVLTAWLRSQGVTARTPLHELRKHRGSLVYAAGGIESARRHLGHRKVTTTSASYLDVAEVVADPTAAARG